MVLLSDSRFARYTVENFPLPAALPTLYSSSRPIFTLCCVVCVSYFGCCCVVLFVDVAVLMLCVVCRPSGSEP